MSRKIRVVLAFTLARSIWQYYYSDWTSTSWSASSIQFMLETDRSAPTQSHITCAPSFTVRFHEDEDRIPECFESNHVGHKYPRILSLGTLLLDVGREFQDQGTQQPSSSMEQRINNACTSGLEASDPDWPHFGYKDKAAEHLRVLYKDATVACFDSNLFKPKCDR